MPVPGRSVSAKDLRLHRIVRKIVGLSMAYGNKGVSPLRVKRETTAWRRSMRYWPSALHPAITAAEMIALRRVGPAVTPSSEMAVTAVLKMNGAFELSVARIT